jgi:hypothetical protein
MARASCSWRRLMDVELHNGHSAIDINDGAEEEEYILEKSKAVWLYGLISNVKQT